MRKLTQKQKEEMSHVLKTLKAVDEIKKAQVIFLLEKRKGSAMVFEMTEYSRRQAYDIKRRYLEGGIFALQDKRKGKPKELLTKQQ